MKITIVKVLVAAIVVVGIVMNERKHESVANHLLEYKTNGHENDFVELYLKSTDIEKRKFERKWTEHISETRKAEVAKAKALEAYNN